MEVWELRRIKVHFRIRVLDGLTSRFKRTRWPILQRWWVRLWLGRIALWEAVVRLIAARIMVIHRLRWQELDLFCSRNSVVQTEEKHPTWASIVVAWTKARLPLKRTQTKTWTKRHLLETSTQSMTKQTQKIDKEWPQARLWWHLVIWAMSWAVVAQWIKIGALTLAWATKAHRAWHQRSQLCPIGIRIWSRRLWQRSLKSRRVSKEDSYFRLCFVRFDF